ARQRRQVHGPGRPHRGLVRTRWRAKPCQVRVRDNGVGIDETLLPQIFGLFTQADRSLDRAAWGLGIGLSLAQRLVALHGGSIEAHSPPDGQSRGSEFVVRLPLLPTPEQPTPQ